MTTRVETDVLVNDRGSSKLDKIADALMHVGRAGRLAGNEGAKGLGKLTQAGGSALKGLTKLPALAAGTVIGTALIAGITDAMDVEDANAKLQAGLGLNKAESAKAGKIAGDLYKNAYGDSVADVSETLSTVFQSGIAKMSDSEDKIKDVTAAVENFSQISGEEALPVTRAVAQMLKTGLAKNAKEAFDILTRGQQLGINKSEDLLDTFNEYGTQFRKLGLDGPAALGLMNQALQAGARDSDIAADALKEFAIRAVDGSEQTAEGFDKLGLSADDMAAKISAGGPKASAALGTVLERLRAIKDPAERSRIAVMLFGTQAEDLGDALYAMDTKTAVKGLGDLAGAADRAGDALGGTTSSKLTTVFRTIKMTAIDAIGKHVLPQLQKFADWFNGPGKYVLTSWAIAGASGLLTAGDKILGVLEAITGGVAKFGRVASLAAAAEVAFFSPGLAADLLKNADAMGKWAEEASTGIHNARTELQGWKATIDKTNTKVKLQAEIADLDAKLKRAREQLKDPKLSATKKAKLTATINELEARKRRALSQLEDPKLRATKVAKLTANKQELESRLRRAQQALDNPKLTATKRAQLTATIKSLQTQVNNAQAKIDSLRGKRVQIDVVTKYTKIYQGQQSDPTLSGIDPDGGRRAAGGGVTAGRSYVVGEHRPELFVPQTSGYVMPYVPSGGGAGGQPIVVQLDASVGSGIERIAVAWLTEAFRKSGIRVVTAGAGRAA